MLLALYGDVCDVVLSWLEGEPIADFSFFQQGKEKKNVFISIVIIWMCFIIIIYYFFSFFTILLNFKFHYLFIYFPTYFHDSFSRTE